MDTSWVAQSSTAVAGRTREHAHRLRAAFAKGAFDELPVAVLCFDGGGLIDANDEWVAVSGRDVIDAEGDGWLAAIHPEDRDITWSCVSSSGPNTDTEIDVRLLGPDDSERWFRGHVRVLDDERSETLRLLTLTSVGAHRGIHDRLLHKSTHDNLTGLAARSQFVARITRVMSTNAELSGMLFIDLDHFKVVNDHLGHRYGDEVLRAVSRRIEATIRSTDLAGRLGGDEIGVFCRELESRSEMFALADRIGAKLAAPFHIDGETIVIDASIGVSFTSDDTVATAEDLIDCADQAMYVAKAAGGGGWAVLGEPPTARPRVEADDDVSLAAVRAAVDHAEEHIVVAWQHSSANHEVERSARLSTIREALRRVSALLRTRVDVDVVSPSEAGADCRASHLHDEFEGGIEVAQATGMIAQRTGSDASQATAMLQAFAKAKNVSVATAARALVARESDIDSVALIGQPLVVGRPVGSPQVGSHRLGRAERLEALHSIYEEQSAAVYGCAAFICGAGAATVTQETFVAFWQQGDFTDSASSTVRVRLLTIAHRLATRAALSAVHANDEASSAAASETLGRGHAIERTLACVNLTTLERSVAALVIYGQCTSREVARILGQPEDDVHRKLKTGLLNLRKALAVQAGAA